MIQFNLENLGPLKKAELELGNLTIITGENNSGKTYISYSLYGFLKYWYSNAKQLPLSNEIKEFINTGVVNIELTRLYPIVKRNLNILSNDFRRSLNRLFSASENEFAASKIKVRLINDIDLLKFQATVKVAVQKTNILTCFKKKNSSILEIKFAKKDVNKEVPAYVYEEAINEIIYRVILGQNLPNPHVITAERTGINIFQNELDINKNVLFEKILESTKTKSRFNPFEFTRDVLYRYSQPIKDSIDVIRDLDSIFKKNGYIAKKHPEIIRYFELFSGISYQKINSQYLFSYKKGTKKEYLPLYLGSTSVRALFDLYIYLKFLSKENDILIIDEPELNLHPKLQVNIAKLLAMLVNSGISVFITTHSDYLMKELNNLLMLENSFRDKPNFIKKYGYPKNAFLKKKDVKSYIAQGGNLQKIEIDKFGFVNTTFDSTISLLNKLSSELSEKID